MIIRLGATAPYKKPIFFPLWATDKLIGTLDIGGKITDRHETKVTDLKLVRDIL